ncbi:iron complex outermembrane receptor protein [Pseudoduganella flava]|nr:iron complex outermembrane receptor protein [Pseudoduganella flava]
MYIAIAGCLAAIAPARATDEGAIDPSHVVVVPGVAEGFRQPPTGSGDAATLLSDTPGYSVAQGGGVSGLPVLNGLADDRLKIRVDGMEVTSACANHMNPPMSYIDPSQVSRIDAIAGVTPVSAGGDSIGGTITVHSASPRFAAPGAGTLTTGRLSLSGRTVNDGVNAGIAATVASERVSFGYSAAYARGHSYEDGNGDAVLGSLFESINQSAVLGLRDADQQLTVRVGVQRIPYQGFPNQYMDMTDNTGKSASIQYLGKFGWGRLDANAYWQKTDHEMGFFTPERTGTMPMVTHGRNAGYAVKATLPWRDGGELRVGHELHTFRLDDFWPAVPGSMMMGPQTYVNVNDGRRDRLAFFGEAETRHNDRWTSLLGARWESVRTDAGAVQPYSTNMMNAADAAAAKAFNARDRYKRDGNLDVTALARFDADATSTYELAAARKTRSPNLYERYSWGRGTMAMTMTNWFGDGNGYVGDIDLKRETAYTLGFTAHWHDSEQARWFVKLNPYFTRVRDYIDVDTIGTFNPYMQKAATGALLRFANHDAKLYGANLSWSVPLLDGADALKFTGNAAFTRGKRTDDGDLYRIMPFNTLLTLEHVRGAWTNQLEARIVARKDNVDARRFEPETGGYTLFNVRTAYQLRKNVRLSAGVTNLFDRQYADPLGGVYLSGLKRYGGALQPLPGYGRSLDVGLVIDL